MTSHARKLPPVDPGRAFPSNVWRVRPVRRASAPGHSLCPPMSTEHQLHRLRFLKRRLARYGFIDPELTGRALALLHPVNPDVYRLLARRQRAA